MCGRFALKTPGKKLSELFGLNVVPELKPRYNIAPTQSIAAIRIKPGEANRELQMLEWGLITSWAKDPRIGSQMINARAETVAEKPSFRSAFRSRRCLIPADGFYEWKREEKRKQPYFIHIKSGEPLAFAGLWEHWEGPKGEIRESCTIITTQANDLMHPIHDRMPVILHCEDFKQWLDTKTQKPDHLLPLLKPFPDEELAAFPVGPRVSSPQNDDATCIQQLE